MPAAPAPSFDSAHAARSGINCCNPSNQVEDPSSYGQDPRVKLTADIAAVGHVTSIPALDVRRLANDRGFNDSTSGNSAPQRRH